MDFITIVNRARSITHTDDVDYTDTNGVEDGNLVYQDLVDRIVSITKGDYFWDKGVTDTVVNQSEYVAEKLGIAPDDLDIKKINKVFIKYTDAQSYPTRCAYQDPGVLDEHPDFYKTNQSKTDPFFYIQDNSIFIYPAPTEVVVGGVEIFVIHKPADLDITTTSDNIEIPAQFHKIIADGIATHIYERQGLLNEAQVARDIYEKGITDMVAFMKGRYNQSIIKTVSSLATYS